MLFPNQYTTIVRRCGLRNIVRIIGKFVAALVCSSILLSGCEKMGLAEPPITLIFRQGVLSKYVAQVSNLSTKEGIEFYLYVANGESSARSGNMVVPANSTKEIGALEVAWSFKVGDKGFVRSVKHAQKLFFEITGDGQYKTWFGFNDIPERDVAADLLARKEADQRAKLNAAANQNANYGRELFAALATADQERARAGLSSVWPRGAQGGLKERARDAALNLKEKVVAKLKKDGESDDGAKEIADVKFGNSTDYFNRLLDLPRKGTDSWSPSIALSSGAVVIAIAATQEQDAIRPENNRWSVLADADDELSDCIPVLVSANFPCEKLRSAWDGTECSDEVVQLHPSGDLRADALVVVYKNGGVKTIFAAQATLNNIYPGPFNTCTNGDNRPLRYLTPNGIKNAIDVQR